MADRGDRERPVIVPKGPIEVDDGIQEFICRERGVQVSTAIDLFIGCDE